MIKRIVQLLKTCYLFWKELLLVKDKKKFIKTNLREVKMQAIILLSAVLVVFIFYSCMKPVVRGTCRIILQAEDDSLGRAAGRVVGIEAKRAKRGTTFREIRSIGTLKANQEVVIKSEIPGKIAEVLFTEGCEVDKDQVLIKFEDDIYKAEKDKCEAEYALRKAEFERVEKLYKQKVGSQKTYDEAFGQMGAAKAQLDHATAQLSRTVIKAPFSGTIGILKVPSSPGNIVQQNTELVNIVDNSFVKVEFSIPAKFVEDIAVGQNVEIIVDTCKDATFTGTVDAIDSEIDQRNHSVLVRAVISNKGGRLKHGMFVNVKLITGEKGDVILIDEDALDRMGSIEVVWVIDKKERAYLKQVIPGAKNENGEVEILNGLEEGDIVVIAGQLKLTDGIKTKILNKDFFETDKKDNENQESETKPDESQKPEDEANKTEEAQADLKEGSETEKKDDVKETQSETESSAIEGESKTEGKSEEDSNKQRDSQNKEERNSNIKADEEQPNQKSFVDSVKALFNKILKPSNKDGSKE
ncbi:MAG: efflux RND transporter periplasmic adaptor subunit [Holosporales bacterium]|jgi:membrane fusion protein (multidrug efflux system)|nr:efflux RND transporter periplasmic adaptor subunit [Holosporales bacterium]